MAKRDLKKAKAKGGKKATKKPLRKKPQKEGAVLAELELRDEQLDAVSGGVTLSRTLPTLSSPTLNTPTLEPPTNLTGGDNFKDALNLGLY
jgi:hypothetical protein